jgi:hypothetical protein
MLQNKALPIPIYIQNDAEEAKRKWDLVHLALLLKPEVKRQ